MKYNPALDGLRAVAVLAVMLFHFNVPHVGAGYLGVDVFFVLSGYLITTLLLREEDRGGIRLGAFYLRRARRLYPALLGLVVLYLALDPKSLTAWQDAGIVVTYLSDYAVAFWHRPVILQPTWSLAVEEHFYLLWPLLLPFVARLGRKRAIYLLATVFLADTVWRMYVDQYADISNAGFRFDTRLSGLTLGCLIAFLPPMRRAWMGMLAFTALAAWWYVPPGFVLPVVLGPVITLTEIAAACAVLWAATSTPMPLAWSPLAYVGRISYGLYLYHYPAYLLVRGHTTDWRVAAVASLVTSFALAMLSYHTVEKRFRSLPRTVSTGRAVAEIA
jgi:peptidoglycan/LPS O-acetylase OafA/YrhL